MSTDGGGRNHASPVSRWQLKPHHQIVIVSVAAFLAFSTIGVVMKFRLSEIDRTQTRFARHAEIDATLTNAEYLDQPNLAELTQLLAPTAATNRVATVTNISDRSRAAARAWTTYKRIATSVPGEAALRATVDAAIAAQIPLIAPILAGEPPAAGVVDRIAAIGASETAAIETLRNLYADQEDRDITSTSHAIALGRRDLLITTLAELVFLLAACIGTFVSVRRRYLTYHAIEDERTVDADRNDLETRVARALEMVGTEEAAYVRIERAIGEAAPEQAAQLLIADSSRAHLRQAFARNLRSETSGCPVGTPRDCPAITRGQTQLFADSEALDACPHLSNRPDGACSATCVPLSVAGKGIGVIHVIAAPRPAENSERVRRLELISRKAGDRIGMLRAFSRSETEARTDQLTGLLNRRSLEVEVRRLTDSAQAYTVAYGDLDHFKELNDVYGHDAGDRALRLFSRVLRDSIRPRDIPARYGGEEFVVVLPDCSPTDAAQVLERVRENLGRAQSGGAGAPFTVSFGLSGADCDDTTDFEGLLKSADRALGLAKEQGRDRIVANLGAAPI